MNDPKARQLAFNTLSRGYWESFKSHRARVTELLSRDGRGTLCVLGAGNCNDLDLKSLLTAFREVHLVDLDESALKEAVERQGLGNDPRIVLRGGIDLTGMIDAIRGWNSASAIGRPELTGLVDRPGEHASLALDGPFDAVASTCLLSQLIASITHSLGEKHPQFLDAVQSIRLGHLRCLACLTKPGGHAVLITDVVSSDTYPNLKHIPESSLKDLLPQLNRDRNFFHGVNPLILWNLLRTDPILAAVAAEVEAIPPWRWDFQIRLYLVVAFRFRVLKA